MIKELEAADKAHLANLMTPREAAREALGRLDAIRAGKDVPAIDYARMANEYIAKELAKKPADPAPEAELKRIAPPISRVGLHVRAILGVK